MPRPRNLRSLLTTNNARRNSSPAPPSPTFSDITQASAMNFGDNGPAKIITRAHLKASAQAFQELINTSATYRAALLTMSKVTAAFADAMEKCAGLKGTSYEAGTRLQASSGLHHLIGNHWHILAETLDRKFEKPLRQQLETYRSIVTERSAAYEKALYEKSRIIQRTEMENLNRRERNLQSFREALAAMQRQVDELDELKSQHYQEILHHEEEVWDTVQGKVCLVVRSTMDVFDKFTSKAVDPVIESMLQTVPDPFDSYGPPQSDNRIFSILPPLSIIANTPSTSPSPVSSVQDTKEAPELPAWTKDSNYFPGPPTEWADVPSPSSLTPPRTVSPPNAHGRAHAYPADPAPHARKEASKQRTRTALSVIDESRGRSEDGQDAPKPLSVNGDRGTSWSNTTYGRSPYDMDDTTPRGSLFLSSSPPDHDAEADANHCESPSDTDTIRMPIPTT